MLLWLVPWDCYDCCHGIAMITTIIATMIATIIAIMIVSIYNV